MNFDNYKADRPLWDARRLLAEIADAPEHDDAANKWRHVLYARVAAVISAYIGDGSPASADRPHIVERFRQGHFVEEPDEAAKADIRRQLGRYVDEQLLGDRERFYQSLFRDLLDLKCRIGALKQAYSGRLEGGAVAYQLLMGLLGKDLDEATARIDDLLIALLGQRFAGQKDAAELKSRYGFPDYTETQILEGLLDDF